MPGHNLRLLKTAYYFFAGTPSFSIYVAFPLGSYDGHSRVLPRTAAVQSTECTIYRLPLALGFVCCCQLVSDKSVKGRWLSINGWAVEIILYNWGYK